MPTPSISEELLDLLRAVCTVEERHEIGQDGVEIGRGQILETAARSGSVPWSWRESSE
jgi:hypothetical protein